MPEGVQGGVLPTLGGTSPATGRSDGVWVSALRRLRRNRAAMAAVVVLLLIVVASLFAPLYADHIAQTDPFRSDISGEIEIDGQSVSVIQESDQGLGQIPLGPTWRGAYFLGADNQGRDVFARLLYGGRYSLVIAGAATAICLLLGALLGLVTGFFGGAIDTVLSRLLDILWAFPVYLLAISLSLVLLSHGVTLGPVTLDSGSLALPIVIIGIIYVPYVARPIRGQVLALKQSEFVMAAIGFGVPDARIIFRDILPNVSTTLVVLVPLMMALNLLTESALSFLSIGVQAPSASWGTIIQDGEALLYTRPLVALAPGLMIVVTVLALNVLGDALRDAFDPRSTFKLAGR